VKELFARLRNALPWFAVGLTGVLAFRRLDDFDTWWHLAAGRWIVAHGHVPGTDPLSFTVPDHDWLNFQWLYDVALYGLWRTGGVDLLVVAAALSFTLAFALLARAIAGRTDAVTSALLLAWGGAMAAERFTLRPEMATFLLLALLWTLLLDARRSEGRHLWLLVPVFVLWANLHSLVVLGIALLLAHLGAALLAPLLPMPAAWRRDASWTPVARRQLLLWGGLALLGTLVNPFGWNLWLFPLELFARIDGSRREVFQVIGEFRPPWSGYFPTFSIGAYQVYFPFSVAVVALAVLARTFPARRSREAADAPGLDPAGVAFFAALAWLSLLARRNVGVFVIGSLPVVALALAVLWQRAPQRLRTGLERVSTGLVVLIPLATIALSLFVVSNRWYAARGEQHEFGLGVFEENFPIHAARFVEEHDLPGRMYNDMTAGGYLTWADPTGSGVYVDGRLEVYDTAFFSTYLRSLSDPRVFAAQVEEFDIQSVLLFHRWGNRDRIIATLARSPDWTMVYLDEVAIVFVRNRGNEAAVARAQAASAAAVETTFERLSEPAPPFSLALARTYGIMAYGRVLENLGRRPEALEVYRLMLDLPTEPAQGIFARQRIGTLLAYRGDLAQGRLMFEQVLSLDPDNATAIDMIRRIDAAPRN
jgi:hypothetical protein